MSEALKPEIIEVDAEEIAEAPVSATVQKTIDTEIKKFDKWESRLNEIKAQYAGLAIVDVNDRDGYEEVRLAIGELRKIRTSTEKDKKNIKKPFLDACKSIEEKSKWIQDEVAKIEDPLQKRKDEIDAEKEKIAMEKKRKQQQAFISRSLELTKMGAQFDGTSFTLEDVSYDAVLLRESDDEVYATMYAKYKEIFDRQELARLEAQRIADEEATRLQRERDDFEEQKLQFEAQQKELRAHQEAITEAKRKEEQRLYEEEKARKDAITRKRIGLLSDLGLKYNFDQNAYMGYDCCVYGLDVTGYDDQKWDEMIVKITPHIEQMKAEEAQKESERIENERKVAIAEALENQRKIDEAATAARRLKIGQSRVESLLVIGFTNVEGFDVLAGMPEDEWNDLYSSYRKKYDDIQEQFREERQRREKELADQKKAAEMEQAKDKDKWDDILTQLDGLNIHEMKSGVYRTKVAGLKHKIQEIKKL